MARRIVVLSLLITLSFSMEMRETVERMVMVRTTGSDLQPAATGYIYKKENDEEASVIEMGESEVMEHLSKLYEKPKAFAAPLPVAAGPFYASEEDASKSASDSQERVIPVKENHEVDGIADDDFKKLINDEPKFDDYSKSFKDYLRGLGNFDHGIYHKYDNSDNNDKGYKGYNIKHYGNNGAGDYHSEKFESYKISGGHNKGNDGANDYKKYYNNDQKEGGNNYRSGHDEHQKDEFHKLYNNDGGKTSHDTYDGQPSGDFHKYYGAGVNGKKADSYESGHHNSDYGKSDGDSSDETTSVSYESDTDSHRSPKEGKFGTEEGKSNSKSYGFKIKH